MSVSDNGLHAHAQQTYRCDSTIAEVDTKVVKKQEPGLRILEGHPDLFPFECPRIQHTGLVRKGTLYRHGSLSLSEDDRGCR